MPTADTKAQTLSEFLQTLEKVVHARPEEPGKTLVDLGLVIFGDGSKYDAVAAMDALPKGAAILHALDNPYVFDDFARKLVTANREGQWLVVDCQTDPSPTVIGILKQLSEDNSFTLAHFEDKELFNMTLNSRTRIIVCINERALEEKVTYPYFQTFFGPVIRL